MKGIGGTRQVYKTDRLTKCGRDVDLISAGDWTGLDWTFLLNSKLVRLKVGVDHPIEVKIITFCTFNHNPRILPGATKGGQSKQSSLELRD